MLGREPGLRSVTIATPIPLHERMVRACLARGLFIYLEKPPVPLLGQLDELIALDRDRRVAVGFQLIESSWSRPLKQRICEGEFGDIREIRIAACWPRPDSYYQRAPWAGRMTIDGEPVFDGPATNALAHLIHHAMFFASAQPGGFTTPVEIQAELYRARAIESYDTACLRARLASGTVLTAAFSHASASEMPYEIRILGSRGWARVSGDGRALEDHRGPVAVPLDEDPCARPYQTFFDYVNGVIPRPSTLLADARGYLLAANGLLASSGKIHNVPAHCVSRPGDGGPHAIRDLAAGLASALQRGALFSEGTFPWAVATRKVSGPELQTSLRPGDLSSR